METIRNYKVARGPDGAIRFLTMHCPQCGKEMSLSLIVHTISAEGTIIPSLVCPHAPCTWHVWARLDPWPPPVSPGEPAADKEG